MSEADAIDTNCTRTDPDAPFTEAELCALLRVRPSTLRRWRRTGIGPKFLRIGRKGARVLYPRALFHDWMNANSYSSESEANQ